MKTLALNARLRLADIITRLHVRHHKKQVGFLSWDEVRKESRPSSSHARHAFQRFQLKFFDLPR